MKGSFVSDVTEIRRRARKHIEQGAVTEAYQADRETVVRILNEALATEIVCVLRYNRPIALTTVTRDGRELEAEHYIIAGQRQGRWVLGATIRPLDPA